MFHFLFRVESLPPTKWPLCRYSIGYFFRRLHPYRLSRLLIFFYTFYYGFIAIYGPECLPAKYRYWLGDTILLSKVKYPKMERVYAFNCLVLGLFAISQFRLIADRQRNRPIKAFLMSILGVHEFSCDDETPEERRRLLQIYCFFRRVQQNIFWTKDEKEKRLNWIEQIQHFVFLYFGNLPLSVTKLPLTKNHFST